MKRRSHKGKATNAFIEGDDGLVGHPDGADINSEGYRKLQEAIRARSKALTADQKTSLPQPHQR
jgi:hypothetical protein